MIVFCMMQEYYDDCLLARSLVACDLLLLMVVEMVDLWAVVCLTNNNHNCLSVTR